MAAASGVHPAVALCHARLGTATAAKSTGVVNEGNGWTQGVCKALDLLFFGRTDGTGVVCVWEE